jgi:NADPH:quinone reductase-like Zn-dependent oxidoreductase
MKAVGVIGPDFEPRLFDIDEPTPARDGIVVKVLASSVNEFDRAAVRGHHHRHEDWQAPVLLGRDFVGRVAAVGENVDYIDVGMYVAGALAPQSGQAGTFTDEVAVAAESLAPVPDGIDLAQVAGVGLAGVSALDAVNALGITGLESVISQGPVSGAGGFALQLAKSRGAVVAALTLPEQTASRMEARRRCCRPGGRRTTNRQWKGCAAYSVAASIAQYTSPATCRSPPRSCALEASSPLSPAPPRRSSTCAPSSSRRW